MALSSALSLPGMYYWGMAIRLVAIAAGEVQDAMCTCNCLPGSHREAAAARRSLVLFVLLALSLRPALFLPAHAICPRAVRAPSLESRLAPCRPPTRALTPPSSPGVCAVLQLAVGPARQPPGLRARAALGAHRHHGPGREPGALASGTGHRGDAEDRPRQDGAHLGAAPRAGDRGQV